MQITLNVPALLFKSLVEAVVQLAHDYRAVNSDKIESYQLRQEREKEAPTKGGVFYQSDRKLHEAEIKQRLKREAEMGAG